MQLCMLHKVAQFSPEECSGLCSEPSAGACVPCPWSFRSQCWLTCSGLDSGKQADMLTMSRIASADSMQQNIRDLCWPIELKGELP